MKYLYGILFLLSGLVAHSQTLGINANYAGQDQIILSVADLSPGRYFLHVFEGKTVTKQQIIIKR